MWQAAVLIVIPSVSYLSSMLCENIFKKIKDGLNISQRWPFNSGLNMRCKQSI